MLVVYDRVGTIAVGNTADLVLIDGDVSADIGRLRQVELVMQEGRIMNAESLRRAVGVTRPPSR